MECSEPRIEREAGAERGDFRFDLLLDRAVAILAIRGQPVDNLDDHPRDLAELFLWPDQDTWYVEMYVTPNNHYTTFLFPSGGRLLPSAFATNAFQA